MHIKIIFKYMWILMCFPKSETKQIIKYDVQRGQQVKTSGKQIGSEKVKSAIECVSICSSHHDCCTANYNNKLNLCTLITDCCPETGESTTATLINRKHDMKVSVQHENPKDCSEIPSDSSIGVTGEYTIYPESSAEMVVYCYEGWTVIQKRQDGTTNFYRPWTDYKRGFGTVSGNYWLGNDKIHILTSSKRCRLRIQMTDFSDVGVYAEYNSFNVGDAGSKYKLSVCGYSGTAGDAMTQLSGFMFSTKDQHNDVNSFNCAVAYRGAWWYRGCSISNLNGLYKPGITKHDTMHWRPWHSETCLKTSLMMIR